MKGIEVKFTFDIKFIVIILLAMWLLFSGLWGYRHIVLSETRIQGTENSIQAIASFLNSQQVPQPRRIPQIPKEEVKKDGK